ncbi:hypothetical protein [uncultured Campylobacter sp.]|uniref:hypothetical protein n=1 Tax=uncultured Campylobacter sp. TaxID=218934 RepID=UPI002623387C|nr:hypothetical protein [uncultured Campylobacter sp.]
MIKNKATLKFKNFTAYTARSFWIRTKLARAGTAFFYSRPAEVVCLERSSADAKSSGVEKNLKSLNLKSLNFKNRNAMGTDSDADRNIRLGADRDINFRPDRAVNFKISNANLKADLARPKAGFR